MRLDSTRWWGALALLLAAGSSLGQGPSPILVPEQKIPLRFSHYDHLTKAGMTCIFCHAGVRKSTQTKDRNLPGHAECDECHNRTAKEPRKEKPPAACETCHLGYSSVRKDIQVVADIPSAYLKFSHRAHVKKKGPRTRSGKKWKAIPCATCHGDFVKQKVGLATRAQLPTMTTCLGCHDNRRASAKCPTCHLTDRKSMVLTTYPTGTLKPSGTLRNDRHDAAWLQGHRGPQGSDQAYCGNCHTNSYCQDCHNGPMKPLKVHPGDFVSTHPIAAKADSLRCASCHRDQSFCLTCHQRLGVGHVTGFDRRGVVGSPRALAGGTFHPQGWVSRTGSLSRNSHGFHAQRNIRQCTGCHSERTCSESCHRSTGLRNPLGQTGQGFSPHGMPQAWLARCGPLFARNRRVCYKCHVATDPNLIRCR